MISILVVIPALIVAAVIIAIVWRRKRAIGATSDVKVTKLAFRWRYILLPLILLSLTIMMTAYFYGRLPDKLAYRFLIDGTPNGWSNPVVIAATGLAVQIVLILVGWAVVMGASRTAILSQTEKPVWKPETLLTWMGNLVALPQIIFGFVILDIFSYNVYQKHLLPVWLFMVIVLVIATIGFIGFFIYMAVKYIKQNNK